MVAPRGSTFAHQELIKQFRLAVTQNFGLSVMVVPYTVGMFRDFDTASRIIHAGEKGTPDLLVLGSRFYLWFDAKTGKASFTKEQLFFKKRIDALNDYESVFKLTSVEQGIKIIKQAKEFYEQR